MATDFPFFRKGIIFLVFLGIIVCLSFIGLAYLMNYRDFTTLDIIVRFGNTVLLIIPPVLPVFIAASIGSGLRYLRRRLVYVADPEKILVAANVNCMCYDKTGTLTTSDV